MVSYKLGIRLRLNLDYNSLIRGALLHDYFFYERHDKNSGISWHGLRHSKIALKNAEQDYCLNKVEKDIILKHMFPLTLFMMPRHREGWIVCLVDKYVALKEYISPFAHHFKRPRTGGCKVDNKQNIPQPGVTPSAAPESSGKRKKRIKAEGR